MTRSVLLLLGLVTVLQGGCACPVTVGRPFNPQTDGFAFTNELRWHYEFLESGELITHKNQPTPNYSLRCFPMVRAAREFFYHAEFRPDLPRAHRAEYETLVRAIGHRNSRCAAPPDNRITIPGFANLHEFSTEYSDLLKSQCGSALGSFFQRGNWRMVFPMPKSTRRKTAERLLHEVNTGALPIVHIYRFPDTTLNHALLIYAAQDNHSFVAFSAYDPNDAGHPAHLRFDRDANTFTFERNVYFAGGPVKAYEVYRGAFY
jgi:hypothetical protein